ncbi:MAG: hypothetical protein O3A18_08500 [Planctomycetota bacterium]|jgi:hypothetical protein|nr:hypothetical protein [Planctomycetota bacterium]
MTTDGSHAAPRPSAGRPGNSAGSWLGLRPATLLALAGIVALLLPLSLLSQPADSESPGGLLARIRARDGLTQANLGEIDPAGETMRFATLGLKNVAVTLLWDRANHYKKVEDWANLSATLEQLTKLQPNFYSVWDFQAHNLSYNISVEFDDFRDRYAWVIKGIEFLRDGIALNRFEPRLLGRMGWFIGHKIGKSDEKREFRKLFIADDDFHERDDPQRTIPERDNWLVSRSKYRQAQQLADSGAPLKTTALIFHSEPMMSGINYGRALEEEGTFGTTARRAWELAGDEMRRFAAREIPTSWNVPIRLGLKEAEEARAERIAGELEELLPGQFAALEAERREALSPEQRAALDVEPMERDDEQMARAYEAEEALRVTWKDVARRAPAELREKAWELAVAEVEARETAEIIARYRDIVNFDFWRASCEAEVTEPALRARALTWKASEEFDAARLQSARQAYEEAFKAWREVLDASPVLREDDLTAEDIAEIVARYRSLLEQLDEPFPSPFILDDVLAKAGPVAE